MLLAIPQRAYQPVTNKANRTEKHEPFGARNSPNSSATNQACNPTLPTPPKKRNQKREKNNKTSRFHYGQEPSFGKKRGKGKKALGEAARQSKLQTNRKTQTTAYALQTIRTKQGAPASHLPVRNRFGRARPIAMPPAWAMYGPLVRRRPQARTTTAADWLPLFTKTTSSAPAAARWAREPFRDRSKQATALVHEAWLRPERERGPHSPRVEIAPHFLIFKLTADAMPESCTNAVAYHDSPAKRGGRHRTARTSRVEIASPRKTTPHCWPDDALSKNEFDSPPFDPRKQKPN